ncbi:MAG TPA: pyridoxamine 5'-phosphate oxidase family protein [Fibrobacteria bacterium]|nr:pyridoxamine 5'-phosphate oxidase family protein [Fibrobacteria bacterium]HOX51618.1 pyridoxamine 5'-phosphate oxidase family protein [Fibrobacteria bacterium]
MNESVIASWNLVQRAENLVLSTWDHQNDYPDARTLFNLRVVRPGCFEAGASALPKGFSTWIATNTSSTKVRQLRANPKAAIYFADAQRFEGLTLQGEVVEILDPAIRRGIWTDSWAMYYPGGLDGGDFTVFGFHPARARYYHGLAVSQFDPRSVPELA